MSIKIAKLVCCLFGLFCLPTNANQSNTVQLDKRDKQNTSSNQCNNFTDLSLFNGSWLSENTKHYYLEHWQLVSKQSFEGINSRFANTQPNAMQYQESLLLSQMSDGIFYIAKVPENTYPVAFKLTNCDNNHFIFENLTHDFPTTISYHFEHNDKLTVTVSSKSNQGFALKFIRQHEPIKPK